MGKTSAAVKNRWAEKAYDRIQLVVKKGQKEAVRAYAESNGMSLNGYICKLISDDMGEQFTNPAPGTAEQADGSG